MSKPYPCFSLVSTSSTTEKKNLHHRRKGLPTQSLKKSAQPPNKQLSISSPESGEKKDNCLLQTLCSGKQLPSSGGWAFQNNIVFSGFDRFSHRKYRFNHRRRCRNFIPNREFLHRSVVSPFPIGNRFSGLGKRNNEFVIFPPDLGEEKTNPLFWKMCC